MAHQSNGSHRATIGGHDVEAVVVCGGGAAGMAAALAAARNGAPVCLVERTAHLGGTVAASLIHTIAGLFDSQGEVLQPGIAAELIARLARSDSAVRRRRMGRLWVLSVCPNRYRAVVEEWIRGERGMALYPRSRVSRIVCEAGWVVQVEVSGPRGTFSVRPKALVDATGTAEVIRQLDPDLLQTDAGRAAAGLIFRIGGMAPGALNPPRGTAVVRALRAAAADGTLPAACDKAWIDVGVHPDEAFVKLFVASSGDGHAHCRQILRQARRDRAAVVAFLRTMPPFRQARIVQSGRLGIRDGGRIRGEYCLTGDDVRQLRKFDDAACRGCWPIEYWDRDRGVSLEHLPDGGCYEIPLRSLKVREFANLWAAGKCLSADPYAHASARVAGACWAMGEAVGKAAALSCEPVGQRSCV